MLGSEATWVGGGEDRDVAGTLMPLLKALLIGLFSPRKDNNPILVEVTLSWSSVTCLNDPEACGILRVRAAWDLTPLDSGIPGPELRGLNYWVP